MTTDRIRINGKYMEEINLRGREIFSSSLIIIINYFSNITYYVTVQ